LRRITVSYKNALNKKLRDCRDIAFIEYLNRRRRPTVAESFRLPFLTWAG
jgi:hypothetical protein